MGVAYFYHLTRRPLEDTLVMLLGKALGAGWRVAVRGTDHARMAALDQRLWLGAEDAFLPHGLAGTGHDGDQPVLLTTGNAGNGAACLMSVHGADISVGEVAEMQRVCVLFDGNDAAALDVARRQWKTLKDAGAAAQYWSEESGAWEMKAQTSA